MAGEDIWVSSTDVDAAILVNSEGSILKSWWPREERLLQERYGLCPMNIDKNRDNRLTHLQAEASTKAHHTHLNAVVKSGHNTYVLLHKLAVIVQIEPEVKIILEDNFIRGAHSPVISGDGNRLLLCSSQRKSIVVYDLESGKLVKQIDLLNFAEIADLYQAHPGEPLYQSIFVRGLKIIDDRRILVGIAPASILEVDVESSRLLNFFQYSDDVGDAVHGLAHLPKVEMQSSCRGI
jgi:WD40 repeat protein